ncbi:MAG TPA: Ig-like domain-containing protein, partial [Candidatus Dormibacteraeota bacterium]|nr:Ig-like domain-containing protein [Candidatus Dormibacteraeota bacterium]
MNDGSATASDTFLLTVVAGNTPPTISDVTDRTINEDGSTGALNFTVGDAESSAASLTVSGNSSNPALVPSANIVFGGSGANRTVTVTPLANQNGTATVTLTVSDGSLTASDSFVLTVTPVNDPPTISNIPDQTTAVGTAVGPIAFTVGDVDTAAAGLTLTGSSSSQTLVPDANIVFGGSGSARTVTVTPVAGQAGAATITVTVSDGVLTTNDTFVLTVVNSFIGTRSFTNTTAMTIPSVGNATPYGPVIAVSGMGGVISNVTATLRGLSHTYPADVDVLLVGPGGQNAMLMSDVGGAGDLVNLTLTFSDAAASGLTAWGQITA